MGRVNLTMQVSLDGIVSNEDQWMMLSEEILQDYLKYYDKVGTIVVGGNSYASMAQYWQNAEQNSNHSLEREIARRINDIPKIVIARSTIDLVWKDSRQMVARDYEQVASEIEKLKAGPGIISVESGVKTWQLFIQNDLFDDLWLLIHPVIASEGEKLFALAKKRMTMSLTDHKRYPNGVVGLYYQK